MKSTTLFLNLKLKIQRILFIYFFFTWFERILSETSSYLKPLLCEMTAVWPSWKRWMRRMTSCDGQTWKDTGHQCESQSSVGTQPVVVAVSLVGVEHGCVVSACLDTSPNTAADSWGSAPGQRNSLWGEETSSPVPSFVYFPSHLSPSWFSALRPRRRNCQSKSFSPLGVREREREKALGQS